MSFVNQPLTQNVAGGLGGQADAQLAREALRNQVQPSKDIMVARTSGGTFLTLREPRGGAGLQPTEVISGAGTINYTASIQFAQYNGFGALKGIEQSFGKEYFCGTANGVGGSNTPMNWIGPPIGKHLLGASLVDDSIQEASAAGFSTGVGDYPWNHLPSGFGGGGGSVVKGNWRLSIPYNEFDSLWLMRLNTPMTINLADDGDPQVLFVADFVDANMMGRVWEYAP